MPTSGKPRGHPKEVVGKRNPAIDSKKFLREFFKDPQDRPKKCDNKGVQCGLKGLARGEDFPTVDPSNPSGAGGAGAGPGAAAASVVPKCPTKETNMKFRKDLNMNQNKTAAPPKEMGSDPATMHQMFDESTAPPVEVDIDEVEILDTDPVMEDDFEAAPMGDPSGDYGDPSGAGVPDDLLDDDDAPVEVGEDEVEVWEPSQRGYSAMTRRAQESDEGGDMMEVGEADIEAAGDSLAAVNYSVEDPADPDGSFDLTFDAPTQCKCSPMDGGADDGVEIPDVAVDEVEFLGDEMDDLGGEEEEDLPKAEAAYAAARLACQQQAGSEGPSSPSRGPSGEAPDHDVADQGAANTLVEVLTPIESLGEVDIEDVELNLFNEASENPHYTVMVKGEPVAKIALQDQTLPKEQHDLFLQDDYPQFVLEGIEQFGLNDTLKSVHARYYAARAFEGDIAAAMKRAASADIELEAKRHIAKVKDDLSNVASLVIEASLKNYIVENPLRDALVQQFRSAGVDPEAAVDLVEEAFRQAGSQYFTMVLNKSEEWMGAPREAMEHHIKEITGMNYRHPGYAAADTDDYITEAVEPEEAVQFLAASVPRSVPLRTAAPQVQQVQRQTVAASASQFTGNWQTDKDAWKQRLNLFGHVASKALANAKTTGK